MQVNQKTQSSKAEKSTSKKNNLITSIQATKPNESIFDVLLQMFMNRKKKIIISSQQTIPYKKMYDSGICKISDEKYNMQIEFNDINYFLATKEDQDYIFDKYCKLLNQFDASTSGEFSFVNYSENEEVAKAKITLPIKNDGYQQERTEYQNMLSNQSAKGNNGLVRKKYLTITTSAKSIVEAKNKLNALTSTIINSFLTFGVKAHVMDGNQRLEIMYNMMNNQQIQYKYSMEDLNSLQCSTKDLIAPKIFEFKDKATYKIGTKLCASQFFKIECTDLSDDILYELMKLDQEMVINIHFQAVDQQKAIKQIRRKITDLNSEKIDAQKKANQSGYDMDILSPELRQSIEGAEGILRSLQTDNERWFDVSIIITNFAKNKNQLDKQLIACKAIIQGHQCALKNYDYHQEDCFNSMLPLGVNKISIKRGLTTTALGSFIPFVTKEIFEKGFYYGLNALSNNMIMTDRRKLANPNGLILGLPGSGKSFSAKREIVNAILLTDDDILICDPQGEYSALVKNLRGTVIDISAGGDSTTRTYINPLDINDDYGDDGQDPLIMKSDFVLSMMELLCSTNMGLSPKQKSMIDTCTRKIYTEYMQNPISDNIPLLEDLQKALYDCNDVDTDYLADSLELYTHGTLNVFNHRTNIDTNNRIVSFDISKLQRNLKVFGMLIVQDHVWNRVTKNKNSGRKTWYYIDEFHLLLKDKETTAYSIEYWKLFRKFGGIPTGITQNVSDFLKNAEVATIFDNSLFFYILRQDANDKEYLSKKLQISSMQLGYITDSDRGCGLMIYDGDIIPFRDNFPKNRLYWLMTSDPEEVAQHRND